MKHIQTWQERVAHLDKPTDFAERCAAISEANELRRELERLAAAPAQSFEQLHQHSTYKDTPAGDARIRCAREFYRLFHTSPAKSAGPLRVIESQPGSPHFDGAEAFEAHLSAVVLDDKRTDGVFSPFNACMFRDECRARAASPQS